MYMGFSSLKGMQFVDRMGLIFMPPKYQPDYYYLRHVPIKKVHIFTFIQVSNQDLQGESFILGQTFPSISAIWFMVEKFLYHF